MVKHKSVLQHNVEIHDIIEIVKEAGKITLKFYDMEYSVEEKKNKTPVTVADKTVHDFLIEKLAVYNYPILSEEGEDHFDDRKNASYVWVVDPLDGTSDYIQKTGDFSILIGLVKDHEPVLGVVYEPVKDALYWAERHEGAYMKRTGKVQKIHVSDKEDLSVMTILLSRNHLRESDIRLCDMLGIRSQKSRGSTSKMCVIARGDAEIYINTSDRMAEWDTCAPHIVLEEAGGRVTDMRGDKIIYNSENPVHQNGFLASHGVCHDKILKIVKGMNPLF